MRILLLAVFLVSSTARSEVISCPERYPAKAIQLSESPSGRTGSGRLLGTNLTSAYMVSGELYSEQKMVPEIRNVKGGRDVGFSLIDNPKWLVCVYGERIQWWEQIDSRYSDCEVKIREVRDRRGPPTTWTATANCK